ncbi:hypothetical protein Hanom_Chr14g01287401 [Helianthus anomalus]
MLNAHDNSNQELVVFQRVLAKNERNLCSINKPCDIRKFSSVIETQETTCKGSFVTNW